MVDIKQINNPTTWAMKNKDQSPVYETTALIKVTGRIIWMAMFSGFKRMDKNKIIVFP